MLTSPSIPLYGSGLLWIDAICIDQEDDDDKSQQLPLMRRIYGDTLRVLIWIGEEPKNPGYVSRCIDLLAQSAIDQKLDQKERANSNIQVAENHELADGTSIGQLLNNDATPTVIDFLCSRSYFTRLWTVQEVVLLNIKSAQVLWGRNMYPWTAYYNANLMIQTCQMFHNTIPSASLNSMNCVPDLRYMQFCLHQSMSLSLTSCYLWTARQQSHVSVPHDQVYALLGMVDDRTRKLLSPLSYERPLGELFQTATIIMVLESQGVFHLRERDVAVDHPDAATWTGFTSFHPQNHHQYLKSDIEFNPMSPITFEIGDRVITAKDLLEDNPVPISVYSGGVGFLNRIPILVTKGFMLDTITASLKNFTSGRIRKSLVSAYLAVRDYHTEEPLDIERVIDTVWKPLPVFISDDVPKYQRVCEKQKLDFTASLSRWVLDGIENDRSKPKEIQNSEGQLKPPLSIARNSHLHRPRFSQEELRFFTRHAELRKDNSSEEVIARHLYKENGHIAKNYGRNIFFTSKGYVGIGPMGDNREEAMPAVQSNDKLVALDGFKEAIFLFILRPQPDGLYTFIGPAKAPGAVDDPVFKAGSVPDFIDIRIR
ncbi:hypothetical protein VTL71DRAFT_12413 [Oculimacula yallundae]|uniref:Heterokaryon incompatibility domain-containing protein n=1 Tax=Oculimacula yallundae TaxID=86028 RepID=A0ABR4CMH9_9HELO